MSELKNCPICGETGGWVTSQESSDGTTFIVGCKHCSCQVRVPINNPEYGVKLWNTRTASPRFTDAEREAMEIALKLCEVGRLENYRINMMCDSKQIAMDNHKIASEAIATVRAMLTEADKGKG